MPNSSLDALIHAKEGLNPDHIDSLDAADLAVASSRAFDATDPYRLRAIEVLARSNPTVAAQAVVQLAQQGGDPSTLAAAIAAIAPAGPLATPLATTAAASPDPVIALAAWSTLQRTADALALGPLGLLAPMASGVVAEHAQFALSVIAYRAGLTGFELPVVDSGALLQVDPTLGVLAIFGSPPDVADFAKLARLPNSELFGLSPGPEATTAIDCGDAHMLLALDPSVLAALPGRLVQAPALAGLIALLDPFGAGYSVSHLVLTWPNDAGGCHVAVHQPDGTATCFGTGEIIDEQMRVTLYAVAQPGAVATDLIITATPAGVELTHAITNPNVADAAPKLEIEVDLGE